MPHYASVRVLDAPPAIDREYDYQIPGFLEKDLQPGLFVLVPFGAGNRLRVAVVTSVHETTDSDYTKQIEDVASWEISLSREFLNLCSYMQSQTFCTFGEAVKAILPSGALTKLIARYSPGPDQPVRPLPDEKREVYEYIQKKGTVSAPALRARFGPEGVNLARQLALAGHLKTELYYRDAAAGKTTLLVRPALPAEELTALENGQKLPGGTYLRSAAHRNVLRILRQAGGCATMDQLRDESGATRAQILTLVEKKILCTEVSRQFRDPYAQTAHQDPVDYRLNEEQQQALDTLSGMLDSPDAGAALLLGVTGSGKTCVMVKLMERALRDRKDVLLLVPEIALTPQSVAIFRRQFGQSVGVLHSGLTPGERIDTYARIRAGEIHVVLGTRSAVFAPLPNLGLLIIDEEQEHTYKSDQSPKYHARDIARFRCASNRALLLLCSATPSFESYTKAKEGTYTLLRLKHRFGKAKLPRVEIVDMREELRAGNTSSMSEPLRRYLVQTVQRGEQAVLFLNRRGYNHTVSCALCSEVITCPHCSVPMTYHTLPGTYEKGYLSCHWCGTKIPRPSVCPACGEKGLIFSGFGTQRVEEEIRALLPEARIARMDADTTSSRFSYDRITNAFRNHEQDILLGTQMVTKGHDFPDVTLVGVLMADANLYSDDFRAAEHSFAMLTQVIGRAGRSDKEGLAVIQTSHPHNDVIRFACLQDYESFFEDETKARRAFQFPPYCDLCFLTVSGRDESAVQALAREASLRMGELIREHPALPLLLYGPFEAPVYRVENNYRLRVILKCRLNRECRAMLLAFWQEFLAKQTPGVRLSIDFNPSSFQ
ncbi:MAG: primosomal protein N' [Clostridia bacterium]|nr:primosomal protein N' [Clostridia bacterium]